MEKITEEQKQELKSQLLRTLNKYFNPKGDWNNLPDFRYNYLLSAFEKSCALLSSLSEQEPDGWIYKSAFIKNDPITDERVKAEGKPVYFSPPKKEVSDEMIKSMVDKKFKLYSYAPRHYYELGLNDMRSLLQEGGKG